MIFLSHNNKDKSIVEPIAIALSKVYGMEKVFYDSWSIQPGEGIIDKMNAGLEKCRFFFFFVSKNSLASNMVKLEWQNAIYKTTQGNAKLIPVKLDDCLMPAILMQSLYIDIYGKGLDFGFRQIIDVINNKNTFTFTQQTYENVRGYISKSQSSNGEMVIEVRAETYVEPISRYIILIEHEENDIEVKCTNNVTLRPQFIKDFSFSDNLRCNGVEFDIVRPTTPGFPIKFSLKNKNGQVINFKGIMRAIAENTGRLIPIIYE